jgi:quercetin dioxygenase-like cupin family protein
MAQFLFSRPALTLAAVMALILVVLMAARAIGPDVKADPDHGAHASIVSEPLVPVSFPDEIDARFRVKLDTGGRQIINVRELDHVFNVKITFEPGAALPWHTHPGPAVATIQSGALTVTNAIDCVPRTYEAGQGFVDPGHGNVHMAISADEDGNPVETVVHVTYFEVPIVDGTPRPTILADDPGC